MKFLQREILQSAYADAVSIRALYELDTTDHLLLSNKHDVGEQALKSPLSRSCDMLIWVNIELMTFGTKRRTCSDDHHGYWHSGAGTKIQ